jgi:hypothetical protein
MISMNTKLWIANVPAVLSIGGSLPTHAVSSANPLASGGRRSPDGELGYSARHWHHA